jgi:TatD DNase family protein
LFIDTHAHLDYDLFDADREAMIQRAKDEGVETIVTIGTGVASSLRAIALAEKYEHVYAVVGLHPTDAVKFEETMPDQFRQMAQHKKVVGIGEIGLDYHWPDSPKEVQHKVFRRMILLACELDLPIVIHNREADLDVIAILTDEKERNRLNHMRGIMHCFSGDEKMLTASLALNFFISFAGNITYKKSMLPELILKTPEGKIVVETDAPFLTPVPHRGRRNESAYIRHTAQKLAEVLNKDLAWVGANTSRNARTIFRLPEV